jgi:hypothetical protein
VSVIFKYTIEKVLWYSTLFYDYMFEVNLFICLKLGQLGILFPAAAGTRLLLLLRWLRNFIVVKAHELLCNFYLNQIHLSLL